MRQQAFLTSPSARSLCDGARSGRSRKRGSVDFACTTSSLPSRRSLHLRPIVAKAEELASG